MFIILRRSSKIKRQACVLLFCVIIIIFFFVNSDQSCYDEVKRKTEIVSKNENEMKMKNETTNLK